MATSWSWNWRVVSRLWRDCWFMGTDIYRHGHNRTRGVCGLSRSARLSILHGHADDGLLHIGRWCQRHTAFFQIDWGLNGWCNGNSGVGRNHSPWWVRGYPQRVRRSFDRNGGIPARTMACKVVLLQKLGSAASQYQ